MKTWRRVGYITLHRNWRGEFTRWHASWENSGSLWSLSLHGFGLVFVMIGPFGWRKGRRLIGA